MSVKFDYTEFNSFQADLLSLTKNKFPRETRNFMGRAGNRLAKNVKDAYKSTVKKKTGNLLKGVKRGRAYIYQDDKFQVRVKNTAPHAHLIEHGHVMKTKDGEVMKKNGKEIFVQGKHVVGKVYKNFGNEFEEMTVDFVDKLLDEGNVLR